RVAAEGVGAILGLAVVVVVSDAARSSPEAASACSDDGKAADRRQADRRQKAKGKRQKAKGWCRFPTSLASLYPQLWSFTFAFCLPAGLPSERSEALFYT